MSAAAGVLYDIPGPRARRQERIGSVVGTVVVLAIVGLLLYKLWREEQFTADKWEVFTDPRIYEQIMYALGRTLRAAVLAIVLAVAFGLVFAMGRLSERTWVRVPAVLVIEFFRAVPLLMLILFISIGFQEVGTLGALVIGLMLYNGSVLAEVFRAGILAVPRGQAEAAYAIGMTKSLVMRTVLVPQAARIMLPAIVSQCVVALKDTALGFVIAYEELVRYGRLIYTAYDNTIPAMLVIAAIYIGLNMSVSRIATWLEARQARRFGRAAVQQAEGAVGPA